MKVLGKPYKDGLTLEQAVAGINHCRKNSVRLLGDAEAMLALDRYASAAALAILAIEENGKENIFTSILLARSEKERQRHWNRFRSHSSKNSHWIVPFYASKPCMPPEEAVFRSADPHSNHARILENFKQSCLYVDMLSDGRWITPLESTSETLAKKLIFAAKSLCSLYSEREITLRELEIRVDVMRQRRPENLEQAIHQQLEVERRIAADAPNSPYCEDCSVAT